MMEEEYKDISEVVNEAKLSRNVSLQELHASIINLTKLISDIFVMFKSASEQMKLEEKEQAHSKIMESLDTLMDENRTIAASIVALADMVKKQPEIKMPKPEQKEQQKFAQASPFTPQINPFQQGSMPPQYTLPMQQMPPPINPQPNPPMRPMPMQQMQWQPPQQTMAADMRGITPPPLPDLDIPDLNEPFPFEDEKKKKGGLFSRFKK